MLYHNSNILLFYNVFDFALLTSISQSFNSSFFFLTYHMKDTEYSVKSLTALYTLSSPTEITLGCFGTWVMKFRRRNFYKSFKL